MSVYWSIGDRMGSVIVTFRIMPVSVDTDLDYIENTLKEKIKPQRIERNLDQARGKGLGHHLSVFLLTVISLKKNSPALSYMPALLCHVLSRRYVIAAPE